ncbi:MAG: Uracil phosphoribosyltransferase [Chlorobi bacterium]|nr:Uracil phosphoribosyltransferase [Chlorobiota bacterium]
MLAASARALGLRHETIDEIFRDAPTDFQVIISSTLPFRVDRFGMIGITLLGRVYLLEQALAYSPSALIALLRHEAEHVRQQREKRFFYIRYIASWLRNVLHGDAGKNTGTFRAFRSRWHGAYRDIPAEKEAYAAEDRARDLLNRK